MGFAVPLASWFRSKEGSDMVEQAAAGPAVDSGYLAGSRLQQMLAEHGRIHGLVNNARWDG